jgi:surface carbohydrate biosynthesis protein (TIGR04326 family)
MQQVDRKGMMGPAEKQSVLRERWLWVCWSRPKTPPDGDCVVLSFLPPSIEDLFECEWRGRLIRAREASMKVRPHARSLYIDLVARIGIVPNGSEGSFRKALAPSGRASQWWYHPVAFKDCESDPTFPWIIAALTIRAVAEQCGLKRVVLVGAPQELVSVLRSGFQVDEADTCRSANTWWVWLRGLGSRALYAARAWRQGIAVRRSIKVPLQSFEVILCGFWDWSVWCDDKDGLLKDRYFKRLPDELRKQGGASEGWFVWLDRYSEPGKEGRRLKDVLAPLSRRQDVVLLQSFLRPWDILKAAVDLSALMVFLRVRREPAFKEVFRVGGFDYYALFSKRLVSGFLDASLPHCGLVALAMERAVRRHQPKLVLSFLEHFPYARACYEGVRRAGTGTSCLAIQHASYSPEKTFLFLHPTLEFMGEPDGCAVPHPDYACAMGTLGRDLFLECGYPKDQVLLTGSPRYDHVRMSPVTSLAEKVVGPKQAIHLLLVTAQNVDLDLDMVEAVCAATHAMEGVKLSLRSHPFLRIDRHPRFAQCKDRIALTEGTLENDLADADLILCTYSTVAEEAFVLGKPVWQWLPIGFNGSALATAVPIPQFGSVASLSDALREFQADPGRFSPTRDMRQLVLERLFYRGDGGAALRVVVAVGQLLATGLRVQQGRRMQTSGAPAAPVQVSTAQDMLRVGR